MAFVCTAMPQHLRSLLFPLLMGCFEDQQPFKVRVPGTVSHTKQVWYSEHGR